MKKLILATILMSMSLSASAMSPDSLRTEVICEEGYKFLVVYSSQKNSGPSVVQMMKEGYSPNRQPHPMPCGKNQSK